MKLNYNVDINKLREDEERKEGKSGLKNKTKLSMQSTVSSALASKLPSAPAQMPSVGTGQGWGKSN